MVPCSLLLTVLASAPGGDDEGWLDLDRSIAALSAQAEDERFGWGALVRSFYAFASADLTDVDDEQSGFDLDDVDLFFGMSGEELAVRVSLDGGDGELVLEDAYARWRLFEWLVLSGGQFKARVTRSGSIAPEGLLFRQRTFLGAAFDTWDDGFELGGHYDQFDYWLTVTDAGNGQQSDHFWSVRGEWALYDAAFDDFEGARESPNYMRVLLGAYLFEDVDQSAQDGGGLGGDVAFTYGPWALYAEWATLDDLFQRDIDVLAGAPLTLGDGDPGSATLSRRLGEAFEAAVRMQDADDADDTTALGASLSWEQTRGARWVADLTSIDGDGPEGTVFSLGLEVGTSGLPRPFLDRELR